MTFGEDMLQVPLVSTIPPILNSKYGTNKINEKQYLTERIKLRRLNEYFR